MPGTGATLPDPESDRSVKSRWPSLLLWVLAGWLLLNLMQAALTQLEEDEPYYWLYALQLDWGYFDHPPAVALLIFLSDLLLDDELGVRLMTVLLSTGSLFLLWLLAGSPRQQGKLVTFFAILLALPFLHVYGFITTPDPPLMFFTILFLWLYKRYLEEASALYAIGLGLCAAALLYSKYHGILVIGFVFLSNLRLIRDPKFYLATGIGVLAFLPHLLWQIEYGFPSIKYHLISRSEAFELKDPITYLINQLVIFNPFVFPFMVIALIKKPAPDHPVQRQLDRTYRFLIYGFWLFFLPFTLRGHIEPQWTALIAFPLSLLLFGYVQDKPRMQRSIQWAAGIGLGLLLIIRLLMLDLPLTRSIPFMHLSGWIQPLQQKADGLPLLYINHFRDPARYYFYTDTTAICYVTTTSVRRNQYDLWDWETAYHDQAVYVVGPDSTTWDCPSCETLNISSRAAQGLRIDRMIMTQGATFTMVPTPDPIPGGKRIELETEIKNPYAFAIPMDRSNLPVQLVASFYSYDTGLWADSSQTVSLDLNLIPAKSTFKKQLQIPIARSWTGEGQLGLSLQTGELPPPMPRATIEISIQPDNQ